MKVLGLISSLADPASRFRILQYKKYFERLGSKMDHPLFFPPKESDPPGIFRNITEKLSRSAWHYLQIRSRRKLVALQKDYDIIWQNRLLLSKVFDIEMKFDKPWVFDMDDAIWLTEGKEQVDAAIQATDMVFAGNEFLASYSERLNKKIRIIPTTVDTEIYFNSGQHRPVFTLGWIGTRSNFPFLEMVVEPVSEFLRTEKNARLIVVSSEKPSGIPFDNKQLIFQRWSPETETDQINQFSVGLMPLPDTEWTRGKCGAKMLQYMACEIPVVVSPVGVNRDLLNEGEIGFGATAAMEWTAAMRKLKNDPQLCESLGKNGRNLVETNYATGKWSNKILSLFNSLTSTST